MKPSDLSWKETLAAAVSFYLIIAIPILLVLIVLHWADSYTERGQWAARQMSSLRIASDALLTPVREAANDLSLLAEQAAYDPGGWQPNGELAFDFARFARHRGIYDQIRLLGPDGMERLRVNHRDAETRIVPADELQDKAHRPYFTKGIQLSAGDVYLSRFDLNIENGRIETPHRPTMRLAQVVFGPSGKKLGLLVLNLDGEKILQLLAHRDRNSDLGYWLVNPQGYWLYNEDPSLSWGFQLSRNTTISNVDGLGKLLDRPIGGILEVPAGQFAFNRIFLNSHGASPGLVDDIERNIVSEEPYWILLTVVRQEQLYANSRARLEIMSVVIAVFLVALVPVAFLWGGWRGRTERDKLRASIYARVIEQSDELVFVTTPDTAIQFANPAVERKTGYSRAEIIGRTPRLFQSDEQSEGFYASVWQRARTRQHVRALWINRRKDGTLFYESKNVSALTDKAGRLTHLVSVGRDVSDEHERQEREMRLVDQLSAQLSHHFNNLLGPIINYAELAADTAEENAQSGIRADIEKVLSGANRLRDVLGKISAMSLGSQLSQGVLAVGPVVRGLLNIERTTLPGDIALSIDLETGMDEVGVEFDDLALILSELISNARDAISGGGEILLSAKRLVLDGDAYCSTCGELLNGTFVDISVSDTGRGMTASELKHAFDPFYSTKQSSKLVGETLGIGLSRVRNRAHANGGHVIIETEEGRGTTVHVYCPVLEIGNGKGPSKETWP
ncbi:PAS domain S-box-containing protein [Breoghania corrubedonensis]|uniref:histidine kinase n=1 Tax=Breoghania corrubedonensis TaxID=665038 RepID=A0A2T5VER1_9HYPH|nr:PAS domain S-box protein [Breoghania corrubedonensis]PTW62237.1 PAS domain S-box-containing protein [Breoghania corrubedonensis]